MIGYILNNEILEAFPLMPRMRQGTNILQHLKVVANAMSENNKKEKTTVTNIWANSIAWKPWSINWKFMRMNEKGI